MDTRGSYFPSICFTKGIWSVVTAIHAPQGLPLPAQVGTLCLPEPFTTDDECPRLLAHLKDKKQHGYILSYVCVVQEWSIAGFQCG
jgi:hypothetical protein